ncbi:MAG: hypothetical protein O3A00_19745 [Planctomycetota bacterium]|nr:hypothetical protein [Planctomycetota bacterium]
MKHSLINPICLALTLAVSGCSIPRSVVWLPDNSGLAFMQDDGSIAKFDLASQSVTKLADAAGTLTTIPGISPQHDVALVRATSHYMISRTEHQHDHIEILIGRQGEAATVKKSVRWRAENGAYRKPTIRRSAVLWSPTGKHILFWYESGNTQYRIGHYNLETDTVRELVDTVPLFDARHAGLNPIRPDDAGYLAIRKTGGGWSDLYFVSWDGWENHLGPTPELLGSVVNMQQQLEPDDPKLQRRDMRPFSYFNRPTEPPLFPQPANQPRAPYFRQDGRQAQRDWTLPPFAPLHPYDPDALVNPRRVEVPPIRNPGRMSPLLPIGSPSWTNPNAANPLAGWKNGQIEVFAGNGRILIDTERRIVDFSPDEQLKIQRQDAIRNGMVHFTPFANGRFAVQLRQTIVAAKPAIVVEFVEPLRGRTKRLGFVGEMWGRRKRADKNMLLDSIVSGGNNFSPAVVAPDGSMIAVTYSDGARRTYTTIFNSDGLEIVRPLQVSGPNSPATAAYPHDVDKFVLRP